MLLRCHKCGHTWEEDDNSSQPAVLCPECCELMPLALARRNVEHAATMIEPSPATPPRPATEGAGHGSFHAGGPRTPHDRTGGQTGGGADSSPSSVFEQQTIAGASKSVHDQETMPPPTAGGRRGAAAGSGVFEVDHEAETRAGTTRGGGGRAGSAPSVHEMDTMDGSGPGGRGPTAAGGPNLKRGGSSGAKTDFSRAAPKEIDLSGEQIGGYVVKKMLGAGGMGAVCLARQVSLDRDIALKILPGRLASHPELLARFTREALSAAQLTHHNIVQVYDVGNADHIHYISMEFVRGENLGTMVKDEGRLTLEDAAGYVLQAARGLKYAHDRGIIHRDIKPDNLMVNEHGIVKIADMGLAKMGRELEKTRTAVGVSQAATLGAALDGNLTLHDVAMGTPAYMAPEQARDASSVDHRADIYSLGCTLYYLVVGSAPFSGSTVGEILSKHMSEPPPRLEGKLKTVPGALQKIIDRCLAKSPDERYESMTDLIRDLEGYLGVESEKGAYTPREQHMELLSREQSLYYEAKGIARRRLALAAFAVGIPLLAAIFHLLGYRPVARGLFGVLVMAPVANVVIAGVLRKTFLFRRLRSVFFGMTVKGWAKTIAGGAAALAALWFLGLLVWWLAFAVVAVGLAWVYQQKIAGPLIAERAPAVGKVNEMLKVLRVRGVPEDALQNFVYRFTAEHWEEFFEELFGYDEMLRARARWAAADHVAPRKKFATWRDPIFRWLGEVERKRKEARERRQLAKVEAARLKAEGVSDADAAKRADLLATQIMGEVKANQAKADAAEMRIEIVRKGPRLTVGRLVYQVARLALAGALLALWGAKTQLGIDLPYVSLIPADVLEIVTSWYGLGFGVVILLQAFSRRWVVPAFALVGLALVLQAELVAGLIPHPMATRDIVFWAGAGLGALGFAFSVLLKVLGEKW